MVGDPPDGTDGEPSDEEEPGTADPKPEAATEEEPTDAGAADDDAIFLPPDLTIGGRTFESKEEFVAHVQGLDTLRGKQANQIGDLRAENEILKQQLADAAAVTTPAPAATDTEPGDTTKDAVAELWEDPEAFLAARDKRVREEVKAEIFDTPEFKAVKAQRTEQQERDAVNVSRERFAALVGDPVRANALFDRVSTVRDAIDEEYIASEGYRINHHTLTLAAIGRLLLPKLAASASTGKAGGTDEAAAAALAALADSPNASPSGEEPKGDDFFDLFPPDVF